MVSPGQLEDASNVNRTVYSKTNKGDKVSMPSRLQVFPHNSSALHSTLQNLVEIEEDNQLLLSLNSV